VNLSPSPWRESGFFVGVGAGQRGAAARAARPARDLLPNVKLDPWAIFSPSFTNSSHPAPAAAGRPLMANRSPRRAFNLRRHRSTQRVARDSSGPTATAV